MAGNKLEEVVNSGVWSAQNQYGALLGHTLGADKVAGDPTNITLNSTAAVKIKAEEEMTTICEEGIANICKTTNFTSATSIKDQAKSEYVLEVGDERAESTVKIQNENMVIENWKGSKVLLGPAGITLETETGTSVLLGPAGITLKSLTETIIVGAGGGLGGDSTASGSTEPTGPFDPEYSPSECSENGYFWCSIVQACLDQPASGSTCTTGGCTTVTNSSGSSCNVGDCTTSTSEDGSTCTIGDCTTSTNINGTTCTVGDCTTSTSATGSSCTVGGETTTIGPNGLECSTMPTVDGKSLTEWFAPIE